EAERQTDHDHDQEHDHDALDDPHDALPSAAEQGAEPRRLGPLEDGIGEDDVRQPDTEVGDDDAPAWRSGRATKDRLAQSGVGVRVAIELAGVAVRDELAALVD